MRRIHLLLILPFAAACMVLLWQGRTLHEEEAALRKESSRAASSSPLSPAGGVAQHSGAKRSSRPRASSFDSERFMSDLNSLLGSIDPNNRRADRPLRVFLFENKNRIASASPAELKEVCAKLAEDGMNEFEELVWTDLILAIAKSDPAWAITKVDQFITRSGVERPMKTALETLGKEGHLGAQNWSPEYAAALGKWLDAAQAEGRLPGMDDLVATLRFDTALATGDTSGAVRQLAHLPPARQSMRAGDLAAATHTPDQRRHLLQEVATATHPAAFREFSRALAHHAGFESARDGLASAKLTPENHDLAASGIAAADIGPDTAARAQWLIASLRSKQTGAVTDFTASWTQAAHKDAVIWLSSLSPGDVRDAAVAGFAPVAARLDGASSMEWALTLTDPAQRDTCLGDVYRTWKGKEPEAAAAYLKQKGIEVP